MSATPANDVFLMLPPSNLDGFPRRSACGRPSNWAEDRPFCSGLLSGGGTKFGRESRRQNVPIEGSLPPACVRGSLIRFLGPATRQPDGGRCARERPRCPRASARASHCSPWDG